MDTTPLAAQAAAAGIRAASAWEDRPGPSIPATPMSLSSRALMNVEALIAERDRARDAAEQARETQRLAEQAERERALRAETL